MFLNINGPPLNQWNPEEYVKSWLISQHRDADDTRTKILKTDEPNIEYKKCLWKFHRLYCCILIFNILF